MTHCHGSEGVPPESDDDLDQREWGILQAIAKNGGCCGLVRVARRLAGGETETEPQPARVRRLYTSLYHEEVNRLVDAGLVTYCDNSGELRLTKRGRSLVGGVETF